MLAGLVAAATLGMPIPAIVILFLSSVPLGVIAAKPIPLMGFPAIFLTAGICVFSIWLVDTPLGAVSDEPPQPFLSEPMVAAYRSDGLRIARDFADESSIFSKSSVVGLRTVAPVVADDWTPGAPARIWVVGYAFRSGKIGPRHPNHWNEPGDLIRLAGADAPLAYHAIAQAQERFGLAGEGEPIAFTWRPNATRAMLDQIMSLAKLFAIFFGLYASLVGLHAYASRR